MMRTINWDAQIKGYQMVFLVSTMTFLYVKKEYLYDPEKGL